MLLLSVSLAEAQVNLGSPYSRYGVGNLESLNVGRANGMGEAAAALRLPYEINPLNPASYSAIPNGTVLFQAGFKMTRTSYADVNDKVSDYDFKLNSINAALSINKYWGISLGMNPYSRVSYNIEAKDSVLLGDYVSNFSNKYVGTGGITDVYFGNAFTYKGFSAGVNLSYFFGPLEYNTEVMQKDNDFISIIQSTINTKVHDFHLRYGLQYSDSIFSKYSFTVGAYYENKANLKALRTRFIHREITTAFDKPIFDTLYNDTLKNGKIQTPAVYGFGLSFISKQFIFAADFKKENWKNVLFFGEKQSSLTNSTRFALGVEYTNDYMSKNFFKAMQWRLGGHFKNTELFINDTQIQEFGFNFGVGLPTKLGAKLNLGFELGQRGTMNNNLVKENYYSIYFNMSLPDRWFVRRRFF